MRQMLGICTGPEALFIFLIFPYNYLCHYGLMSYCSIVQFTDSCDTPILLLNTSVDFFAVISFSVVKVILSS